MRIVIFGPPGAGKGTQAQHIAGHYKVPHISTGDIFRQNIREATPLGLEAKRYSDAGDLVPDALTNAMVKQRISAEDCRNGFLLDGYPRTVAQADELAGMLEETNSSLTVVINLIVPDAELIERLGKRGRADDTIETIGNRLKVYHESTKPLIGYYRTAGLLSDVEGVGSIEAISHNIISVIDGRR